MTQPQWTISEIARVLGVPYGKQLFLNYRIPVAARWGVAGLIGAAWAIQPNPFELFKSKEKDE
jgi:hypothetical protein